jgi:ParB/RepB/Spo0J family partition protein
MTTTAIAPEIQLLSPKQLDAHPKNPHGKLSEKDPKIQELKALMGKHGQTQPGLVRPMGGDRYEIVIGHRRAFVCDLLGLDFHAVVRDLMDDAALALMLSDNESHERPDPFLEAEAIRELLNPLFKWTVRDVADLLGKPVRWVAQRANLLELSPKVRKTMKVKDSEHTRNNPFVNWPIAMLEEFAKLPQGQQDELLDDGQLYDCFTLEDLSRFLRDKFHLLGKAPWDLADDGLYPAAGACTVCPKTSLSSPGLFDDEVEGHDVKKATCRDGACWKMKQDEHALRAIAATKEKHPNAILVKHDRAFSHDLPASVAKEVVPSYDVEKVKKSTPGAVPAIVLGGEKGPVVEYVLARKDSGRAQKKIEKAKPGAAGDEKERLRASKEKIGQRRRALLVDKVREAVDALDSAPVDVVPGLAAAFKVDEPDGLYSGASPKERKRIYDATKGSPERFAKEIWPRLGGNIAETLRRFRPDDLEAQHQTATWVAGLLGIDSKALVAQAVAEIPDPKWWGKGDAPPAADSDKGAAPLVLPGVCRGCGCTHEKACPGGCSWIEAPDPKWTSDRAKKGVMLPVGLCSSCAGSQPKGKKAAKKKGKART